MARNTNINEILFDVWQEPVYLNESKNAIIGYKANVGKLEGKKVFSVVTNDYRLISNKEALEIGKGIHAKLFPGAKSTFEIFNIISTATKSFCQIDIIDKNYVFNIWNKEVFVPFIRIHNSYNRIRSLKFDIGFCRKLCDNGAIFEQDVVKLKFAHTKQSIFSANFEKLDLEYLKNLEKEFIKKTSAAARIVLPEEYFLPLAAKTLNKVFNTNHSDKTKKDQIERKIEQFAYSIGRYTEKYLRKEKMESTAYAFFNVITDYASNDPESSAISKNTLQTKCGIWVNSVENLVQRPDFNWGDEIADYEYLWQYLN